MLSAAGAAIAEHGRIEAALLARRLAHRHLGAVDEMAREKCLTQRPRAAGDQRHVDVVPVLAAGVLQDRPALQQAVGRTRDQAVAGLPERHLRKVAQADRGPGRAAERDLELALLLAAVLTQTREHQLDLPLQRRLGEGEPVDRLQHHRADASAPMTLSRCVTVVR